MFKSGDIIEYCDELFEVDMNHGGSGTVWELNFNYERTGLRISNFYWSAYGEDCKLVKGAFK
jgi:hypothetical protein